MPLSRRSFLAATAALPLHGAPARRPNIVYIMSDDHAAHAISAYGSRVNKTPNIDRIARNGVRLDNCFCTNSICTPSRAVILTGKYSHRNGVYTLADPFDGSQPHLAKHLQSAGYQTAIVGKWHLHSDPTGFDYWNILPGQGAYHDPVLIEMGTKKKLQGYATDLITDISLDWLQRRDPAKPFFLMCHHKAPHRPWQPSKAKMSMYTAPIPEPPGLFDNYENRSQAALKAEMRVGEHMTITDVKQTNPEGLAGNDLRRWAYQRYMQDYLRCIASVDDSVGRILDWLEQNKLTRDTIVIYTSDQGFFLGDHGWYDKRFMYEESLRMPFVMQYPAEIKPGATNRDMILNLDFAPTLLDYAGTKSPADMQGRTFRTNVSGKTPGDWRKTMYYRYWMHLADHHVPAHYGVRTERYKLIYYYGDPLGTRGSLKNMTAPEWELFDLEKDPGEMRNVYADPTYASVAKSLKTELQRLQTQYGDKPYTGPGPSQ